MNAHVYVVEVMSDGGNEVYVYRTKRGAEKLVAAITRQAKAEDDGDLRAYAWRTDVREEGDDPA